MRLLAAMMSSSHELSIKYESKDEILISMIWATALKEVIQFNGKIGLTAMFYFRFMSNYFISFATVLLSL